MNQGFQKPITLTEVSKLANMTVTLSCIYLCGFRLPGYCIY